MELKCAVQTYEWGKIGRDSQVAKLMKSAFPDFEIKPDMPYAELWMGTHPSGPSILVGSNGKTLSDWIDANPSSLGHKVVEKFGNQLPFLFKVLSVNKALSIQAHPNKSHSEQLHKAFPDIYKDPNHKPEMAIALTPFEALCGFRPLEEILLFLNEIPEFRTVVDGMNAEYLQQAKTTAEIKSALRTCFNALMICPPDLMDARLASLVKRFEDSPKDDNGKYLSDLLLRIHSQFPGDVGCFCIYFFNYIDLKPGEAIFLGPNEPHAYLFGDCIECMACSDNVVRAGLTPKFKDVPTLIDMLTYECQSARDKLFESIQQDDHTVSFSPPVPDFAVSKTEIPAGVETYSLAAIDSASIFLVIHGEASIGSLSLKSGTVIFVSASESPLLTIKSTGGLLLFRAACNV